MGGGKGVIGGPNCKDDEKAGSKTGCPRGKWQAVTVVGSLKLEGKGLQGSLVGNLKAETQ